MLKFFKLILVGCSLMILNACGGGSDSEKSTSEHTAPLGNLPIEDNNVTKEDENTTVADHNVTKEDENATVADNNVTKEDENTTVADNNVTKEDENATNVNSVGILKATGISQSFNFGNEEIKDGTLKDDGFYQLGVKAKYNKNQNLGIVTDEVSGLSWQDKNTTIKDFDGAEKYCEALEIGNLKDWRLPNIKELESIIDYGKAIPAISSKFIANKGIFISSTVDISNSNKMWAIDFESGRSVFTPASIYQNVRCVRSDKPIENIPDLIRKNNNIVTDNITKLQWEDDLNAEGNISNWETAITYCETLKLGNFLDWRLPNIIELKSLTDRTKSMVAIKGNEFLHTSSGKYWSSSTNMKVNNQGNNKYFAWIVDFGNAQDSNIGHKHDDEYNVRCVRSAK